MTLMGDGWLDSPTSCDVSNWEQSFLFGENKHFDNPSTVNPSHPSNNGIPGISPIPVATLLLDLVCIWGGPGIQKNDIKFPNFSTPHILYKLLSICQTPLIWADIFEYKYPVQGGYFQEQFQQKLQIFNRNTCIVSRRRNTIIVFWSCYILLIIIISDLSWEVQN